MQTIGFFFGHIGFIDADSIRKFYQFYSIGIDIEAKQAEIAKRNGSGRTIGGRSVWGSLIDPILERYHWTFDYVMWGISYMNLQMLLADAKDYFPNLSGEKKDEVIDATDPKNRERVRQMLGWK